MKHAITVFTPRFIPAAAPDRALPTSVRREDVQNLLESGAQLVDVLPREQYQQAHLPGAISLPLGSLNRQTAAALSPDVPVIVYGEDSQCDLSARAAWRLAQLGFSNVFRYTAGKADWLANGLGMEGSRPPGPTVGQLASARAPTCSPTAGLGDIRRWMAEARDDVCVVVNDEKVVLGLLRAASLPTSDDGLAEDAMEGAPRTYRPDADPGQAASYMRRHAVESVLVTTSGGCLLGVLRRADAEGALQPGAQRLLVCQETHDERFSNAI